MRLSLLKSSTIAVGFAVIASVLALALALVSASAPLPSAPESLTLVPLGSAWSYRPVLPSPAPSVDDRHGPDEPAASWLEPGFNEAWRVGRAGSGLVTPPVAPMFHRTIDRRLGFRLRHTFEITAEQLALIQGLRLRVTRGDGVVVYLNGAEVYRLGSPYDKTDISPSHGVSVKQGYYYRWFFGVEHLVAGTNVVAVETYRRAIRPDDPDCDLELVAQTGEAVIWRGPYLQKGSPHSATLRFVTNIPVKPVLRYGKRPGQLDHRQTGPLEVNHTLIIEGLDPDTTYHYAVELGGRRLIGSSGDQRFRTHPPAGAERPTRIWVLGDSGQGQFGGAEAVRDAYLSYAGDRATDVWLMLGDNAYNEGRIEEYQDALFDEFPTVLRNTFLWPSIGNHDKRAFRSPTSGPYFDLFDLPTRGEVGGAPSKDERFYSFDYGNIHFVVLDSEAASLEADSLQIAWLERDLEQNRSEWTIGIVHAPPYSKGNHDSDGAQRHFNVRGNAVPILEAHGMDLMLAGHSHNYERSYQIRGHYGTSDTWDASAYLVDGGDGCPADAFVNECSGGADGAYGDQGTVYTVVGCSSYLVRGRKQKHPVMARGLMSLGSMVIDIEGKRLEARFLRADGEIGDRFVILHPAEEHARR